MTMQIGLREANQHFVQYIHEVEKGEEIIITRRGEPIARLLPMAHKNNLTKEQKAAWKRLLTRAKKGYNLHGLRINRDEIHDRS